MDLTLIFKQERYLFHTFTKNLTLFAQNCIDNSIPFIRLSDNAGFALELMQEAKCNVLAVVEQGAFCGLLTENFLLELDDLTIIESLQDQFLQFKITDGTHLFDILRLASEQSFYFFPVVGSENEYLGITSPNKLLDTFIQYSSVSGSGGIIVLELETKNYSLTEISKIVESNNAMILHSMMAASANQQQVQVSLKINKNDLKDIQFSFERYQYNVIAVLHQSEFEQQLKERYDSLMKYLEV